MTIGKGFVPAAGEKDPARLADAVRQIHQNAAPQTDVCHVRLTKSSSNLLLSRYNGKSITVNGSIYDVPSAGVTLAPSGLSANTVYFIYAYISAGVLTLEASTTARAEDSATGAQIKTGDATRRLVGMARTNGSTAWVDTDTQCFVTSWFNRCQKVLIGAHTNGATTTSTGAFVELSTASRVEFLAWSEDEVLMMLGGSASQATVAGQTVYGNLGIDGVSSFALTSPQISPPATDAGWSLAGAGSSTLTEGYHYLTPVGLVGGGQGSYFSQAVAMLRA